LTAEERKELFYLAAEQIRGRIAVLGCCNAFTPGEATEYARAAKESKLDGILLSPPPYIVPNELEILAYYWAVSDAVDLPICVYNWPRGTSLDLGVATMKKLALIDNVVAIKNSTGSLRNFLEGFFAVRDRLRYFGFPMNELGITLVRHQGGDGTIGAGAVLGSDHPNFFNHAWKGELEKARQCGARDRVLFEHWLNPDYSTPFGSVQAIFKTALNLQGLPGGYPRLPLLPLTDAEVKQVKQTLILLGLLPARVG
jgi:4-hydroxy-tetrahydrodipicolinate synthase